MPPLFSDDHSTVQGSCGYQARPATEREITPRIVIPVEVEGLRSEAVVDTGGVYLVCDPELAEELNLSPASACGFDTISSARFGKRRGTLHRVTLALLAEEGQTLYLEVTAFVPQRQPEEHLGLPLNMGLGFCLETLRFAVDPATSTFHFADTEANA